MAIANFAITGSTQAIYTSSGSNAITTIIVCNPTVATVNLTMYAVPASPGTPGDATNVIVYQLPIPSGDTVSFDQEKMVLSNGDSIQAKGNGLVSTVSTLPV
jgi:hypothetical protein